MKISTTQAIPDASAEVTKDKIVVNSHRSPGAFDIDHLFSPQAAKASLYDLENKFF